MWKIAIQLVNGQPLIITGFGIVKRDIFFVELYATEAIRDLSAYTLYTAGRYGLPPLSVREGFILLGTEGISNGFFGNAYKNYIVYPNVTNEQLSLKAGNDGIVLSKVSEVIDYFGPNKSHTTDSCECQYEFGWGKRKLLKLGANYKYQKSEWHLHKKAMNNCKDKTNTQCSEPFPVKADKAGYLTNLGKLLPIIISIQCMVNEVLGFMVSPAQNR